MTKLSTKKRGLVLSTTVGVIIIIVTVIILVAFTVNLGSIIKGISVKETCSFSFLMSSWSKTGGVSFITPECEYKRITITAKNITDNKAKTEKKMEKSLKNVEPYKTNTYTQQYIDKFDGYQAETDTLTEWYIDEQISNELNRCWTITGRGELNLFDDWYAPLTCKVEKDGTTRPCTKNDVDGWGFDYWKTATGNGISIANPGNWDVNAPTNCVLCARVRFDESLKNELKFDPETERKTIPVWLANNHVVGSTESYAENLNNKQVSGLFAKDQYQYSTDQSYAVVYMRVNILKVNSWMLSAGRTLDGLVSSEELKNPTKDHYVVLKLIPYNDLPNQCTTLVG